jgi:cation diffusion facilitator family transporter
MGAGHDHGLSEIRHEKPLWWALGLTAAFMLAEVAGGLLFNSLALLSDAAHMMTDVVALAVSLAAVRISRWPADARRSYGYARMEAIGALVNGGLLFVVAGVILWEALGRFREPQPVASAGMLAVAVLGLVVNLVAMRLLKAGSGESLNVKGAYLEVWSDMLGSLGVITGAVLIRITGWTVIDPVIAVLIGLWVLPRTWVLLRQAVHVLMQGVPEGIDLEEIRRALQAPADVAGVHALHVWALGSRQPVLTAHVALAADARDPERVRVELVRMLDERFHIHHVTLQIERDACGDGHGHDHGHAAHAHPRVH